MPGWSIHARTTYTPSLFLRAKDACPSIGRGLMEAQRQWTAVKSPEKPLDKLKLRQLSCSPRPLLWAGTALLGFWCGLCEDWLQEWRYSPLLNSARSICHAINVHQSDIFCASALIGLTAAVAITARTPSIDQHIWTARLQIWRLVGNKFDAPECAKTGCSHIADRCPYASRDAMIAIAEVYRSWYLAAGKPTGIPGNFAALQSEAKNHRLDLWLESDPPLRRGPYMSARDKRVLLAELEALHALLLSHLGADAKCLHYHTCASPGPHHKPFYVREKTKQEIQAAAAALQARQNLGTAGAVSREVRRDIHLLAQHEPDHPALADIYEPPTDKQLVEREMQEEVTKRAQLAAKKNAQLAAIRSDQRLISANQEHIARLESQVDQLTTESEPIALTGTTLADKKPKARRKTTRRSRVGDSK